VNLINRFTMSEEQWAQYRIYKDLPTSLNAESCDDCGKYATLYRYNVHYSCSACIGVALSKRSGMTILQGGNLEPIDLKTRNNGPKLNKKIKC
jgi:hypothetical protein